MVIMKFIEFQTDDGMIAIDINFIYCIREYSGDTTDIFILEYDQPKQINVHGNYNEVYKYIVNFHEVK